MGGIVTYISPFFRHVSKPKTGLEDFTDMYKILIVDDEEKIRALIKKYAVFEEYEVLSLIHICQHIEHGEGLNVLQNDAEIFLVCLLFCQTVEIASSVGISAVDQMGRTEYVIIGEVLDLCQRFFNDVGLNSHLSLIPI